MVDTIEIVRACRELSARVRQIKAAGKSIGLVPTMGALHEGHLSLVRRALQETEFSIVTIYLNPTQFAPQEDFASYPKTLDADIAELAALKVPLVFVPSTEQMYPAGFSTLVQPPKIAHTLEGQFRPNHFQGVATVVLKLLNLTQPDTAFFGQKDYQQSLVVRRIVDDLNVPTNIRVCPIVREPDHLAMSSRNVYLTASQRVQARSLSRALEMAGQEVQRGNRDGSALMARMQQMLIEAGVSRIDYAVIACPNELTVLNQIEQLPVVALIAAHVGSTRLIDNRLISEP